MATAFDVKMLWNAFKDTFSYVTGQADKKKENVIQAHKTLNSAFIQTYDYLRNKKGQYITNTDLAEIWNEASAAVMKVDESLGNMLYYKSRFWLDPQSFFDLKKEDEIIELNQIIEEMEMLRMQL
jgi:hypothetical protein